MANRLDIIIFGVTGFTGLRTIPYLTNIMKGEGLSLTWGVAGRSEAKIKKMLKEFGEKLSVNYDNIPIIIADANDETSIKEMTKKAKLIINAAGPYKLYGEQVVKACLESSTHHVDVSGESVFIESVQLKYHEEAKRKGIYIVSACGVDSIPGDCGIAFLLNNFKGTLNSVDTYMYMTRENPDLPGSLINNGTYKSAIHTFANPTDVISVRKELFAKKLPSLKPKSSMRFLHKSNLISRWCVPLPEPDYSVIRRSQRYFYELYNQRPVQVNCYAGLNSIFYILLIAVYGSIILLFSQFSFTRNLLLKYPRIFSFGVFGDDGPSDEQQESTIFHLILKGKGWPNKLSDPFETPKSPPTKEMVLKISGRNPGYGVTCAAFALSAVTILTESNKMPESGGVYPPGVAFAKTSLMDKLPNYGVSIEVISSD